MDEPFTLGQSVLVKTQALALYPNQVWPRDELKHAVEPLGADYERCKQLYRRALPEPRTGIIVGWRRRATGWYDDGYRRWATDPYSSPFLRADKYHKLWMVACDLQWKDPIEALAEDIEPLAKEEGA